MARAINDGLFMNDEPLESARLNGNYVYQLAKKDIAFYNKNNITGNYSIIASKRLKNYVYQYLTKTQIINMYNIENIIQNNSSLSNNMVYKGYEFRNDYGTTKPNVLNGNLGIFVLYVYNYTVTLVDYDGSNVQTYTVEQNKDLYDSGISSLPVPNERENYIFDGWYDSDGNKLTVYTDINADITYTAKYTPNFNISVKFYNNVTNTYENEYTMTEPGLLSTIITTLPTPAYSASSYRFNGWVVDGYPVKDTNYYIDKDTIFATDFSRLATTNFYYNKQHLGSVTKLLGEQLLESDSPLYGQSSDRDYWARSVTATEYLPITAFTNTGARLYSGQATNPETPDDYKFNSGNVIEGTNTTKQITTSKLPNNNSIESSIDGDNNLLSNTYNRYIDYNTVTGSDRTTKISLKNKTNYPINIKIKGYTTNNSLGKIHAVGSQQTLATVKLAHGANAYNYIDGGILVDTGIEDVNTYTVNLTLPSNSVGMLTLETRFINSKDATSNPSNLKFSFGIDTIEFSLA